MADWGSLLNLRRSDFPHPDKVSWDLVQALDVATALLGVRPVILSDWRAYDPANSTTQHHISDDLSRAVDVVFPNTDTVATWDRLLSMKLFTGLGIYQNDNNAQSFHLDTRIGRTVDEPATWGGVITHPFDVQSWKNVRKTEYLSAAFVLDLVKKNGLPVLVFLVALSLWYVSTRS